MFLGDSGSYLISFIVGVTMINFSNNNDLVSPYYIAAILWYPAYENLFSIIRKLVFKKSPSNPDNEHLHQFIFIFIKKKFNLQNLSANILAGLLINLSNFIFLYMGSINPYNTILQLNLLLVATVFYIIIYFITKSYLKRSIVSFKE